MPQASSYYPGRDDVIAYLEDYEHHYQIPVERPVWVESVLDEGNALSIRSATRE